VRVVLDTITRWQIPVSYFSDFLTSMAMDLTITEYASHDDLNVYMWGSAAVIGLQMLPILGYADEHPETELGARAHAIDLGIAFQLTNFLRDVSDDLVRGRIYLPQDSLRACGVDRDRLLHARATGAIDRPIRDLIALEVDRARRRYRTAEAGIDLVDRTSRDCLRTALTLYSDILTVIEENDHNVFSSRATVGFGRRARVAALGLAGAWASRRNLQGRRRQGLV
jgi:phytoene synthase